MKIFSIFNRLRFIFKKPVFIIVLGEQRAEIKRIISLILKKHFKAKKEIFILETEEAKIKKYLFFLKNTRQPVLVINSLNQASFAKNLPNQTYFVLNNDNQKIKEFDLFNKFKNIRFGLKYGADIFASDINYSNSQTNFKINYKGSIIPFWLKGAVSQEQIKLILSGLSVSIAVGLNLVEVSQSLKELDF